MTRCGPRCQVGFHTWLTTCFDFDRPGTVSPDRPGTVSPDRPGTVSPDRPGIVSPDRPGTVITVT